MSLRQWASQMCKLCTAGLRCVSYWWNTIYYCAVEGQWSIRRSRCEGAASVWAGICSYMKSSYNDIKSVEMYSMEFRLRKFQSKSWPWWFCCLGNRKRVIAGCRPGCKISGSLWCCSCKSCCRDAGSWWEHTENFSLRSLVYVHVVPTSFYLLIECTKISIFSRVFRVQVL